MLHQTHGYPLRKLYLAIHALSYALHTQHPYPARRGNPGKTPNYNPKDNATAQKVIKNQFAVNYKLHHDENTMDMALIKRLYAMLDPEYAQELQDRVVHFAKPTFLDIFDDAVQKQGQTTPSTRMENIASLTSPRNSADGIHRLWWQIRITANYATYAGHPIQDSTLVDAALICIAWSQAYKQSYLDF